MPDNERETDDLLNCVTLRLIEAINAQAELVAKRQEQGGYVAAYDLAREVGVSVKEVESACRYRVVRALALLPHGYAVHKEEGLAYFKAKHPRSAHV